MGLSIHSTANMLNVLDTDVIILDAHSLKYLLGAHQTSILGIGDTGENRTDKNTGFCGAHVLVDGDR